MLINQIKQTELETIHEKTLYLLEHVGVDFEHPELLELYRKQGLRIEGNRVYFDKETVERALSTAPASFVMKTPFEELKIGEGGQAICSASGSRKILRDNKVYDPTPEDYVNIRKLDASSSMINLSSSPLTYIPAFPKERAEVIKGALTLKYSTHPVIMSCFGKTDAEETIQLARDFYDTDEGYYTIGVGNVISPMRYAKDDIEGQLAYTKRNLPVVIACCAIPGMTSPVTLGGTIVQNNAEVLAGVIMTQLVNPGAPVVYGNTTYVSNMRKAMPVSWGCEEALFIQYAKAMADYYHIPCRTGGSLSMGKELDYQNGAETAMSLMTSLDVKADFIFHSFGEMDGLNVFSFEKYVLDEQMMAARKSAESIDIFSEEDMDLETIEEVGPGGNYLAEEETILRYRTEIYYPELYSLENYADWERNGRVSVEQKAKERVEKRLREYTQPEYTAKQRAVLEKALEGFDL